MKKPVAAVLCLLLVAAVGVASVAAAINTAKSAKGSVVSETANRVNFTLENTNQVFDAADGNYVAELLFSAEKTEADFYAVMNSLTVENMRYDRVEVVPAEDSELNASFYGAVLPVRDGKPAALSWKIRIFFSATAGETFSPEIVIDYSSGVKKETAAKRLFTASASFAVEKS